MQIEKYMGRLSGPLLDRIDLHVEVPTVAFQDLSAKADGTPSAAMREQVYIARAIQADRFAGSATRLNGRMSGRLLRKHCVVDEAGRLMLQNAMDKLGLSARAHDRILRMARTIADLEGTDNIQERHVSEAIGYRSLDRKLWKR